ncbi:hypothetical protein AMELA_G00097990 [Ameiurus melas]|uniref:Sarcolipin n=2 Tax=Ictaluridae TaxID=7996 RepID=A0A7J6ASQ0_AMEME|nr:hypothetical protein AMELA_G00097990 [Ameiurus melas]
MKSSDRESSFLEKFFDMHGTEIEASQQNCPGPSYLCRPSSREMDRSTQELFLNFMIVLITVLLMWLLVRTYQEA